MSMQLPWLLVSAALILVMLAFVYRWRALKGIRYRRYFSERAVFEGDTVEMVEVIANAKLLPLPWLRLESSIAAGLTFGRQSNLNIHAGEIYQNHSSLFYLRSYRQITRRHQVVCSRRGQYRLESATMTTGDPLGLNAEVKRFPLDLELLVYPRILELQELPLPNHSWLGELPVRRWIVEDPFLTAGIREYRPGDPLGNINWKATARTGELQVHKRDYTADHRLMICLNLETSDSMWRTVIEPERIELGIRYAATVAEHALRSGLAAGFACNARLADGPREPIRIEPHASSDQLTLLLESLARMVLDRTATMIRMLEIELEAGATDTDYLIISCHQGEKLAETAELLRQNGNGVEWMEIPAV
ncbi:DUF58 domain-containing protein [uncultured Paenibacillus sp.]|uniref:DUF58 domain-containing protein n=1 Tax=uncultured Paenibacillus sp. TaxID=227322 RepID=UPI0028044B70|nr:DUF58 domain-containing protein [uncultured Paenibacillus sp.]